MREAVKLKKESNQAFSAILLTRLQKADLESSETGLPISGDEVAEVFKKLLGGKAPGVDKVHPEFLRALDVVGLSRLTSLGHRGQSLWTGRSRWWSPSLKRGTEGCVPTTGGSHSSASLAVAAGEKKSWWGWCANRFPCLI